MTPEMMSRAAALLDAYRGKSLKIATAESCTGGLVAALLTEISGSSAVVERGFVTYSNEAKTELIGVPADLIATHGAVSEPVARAMAEGALTHSRADVAVGITGVAGPTGGTAHKPVGLTFIGVAWEGGSQIKRVMYAGDRAAIRDRAAHGVLWLLHDKLARNT